MIYSLFVKNIALIKELQIIFSPGLNVLSGETGAGKSIIVDSMNLVLGERADRDLIRTGEAKAKVEAILYESSGCLDECYEKYGIEKEESLILSRELTSDGKNICRINGSAVNLGTLKDFTDKIIDLHGQHEHQTLLNSKTHVDFVDSFAGEEITQIKGHITSLLVNLKSLYHDRSQIGGSKEERLRMIDLLQYEITEIEKAAIKPGEETNLKDELAAILHSEKIITALSACHDAIYSSQDSVLGVIGRLTREMEQISEYNEKYAQLSTRLNESYYQLEDLAQEAGDECNAIFFDENRIAELQERLDTLYSLKRKFGGSEESVLAYLEDASNRLEKLQNSDMLLEKIQSQISKIQKDLYALYLKLSEGRRKVSSKLERLIETELKDLGMASSVFKIHFDDLPPYEKTDFNGMGVDRIEFMISTNLGEPLKPLSKIVSGGEVSRIMLAFKNVLANTDKISTLIFDEIDTGISGKMAHVVAEKLSAIGGLKQVICVTHLPQIAAIADANFLIIKQPEGNKTVTHIEPLDEKGKIAEVARLSGGSDSENSLNHAREMIQNAKNINNK